MEREYTNMPLAKCVVFDFILKLHVKVLHIFFDVTYTKIAIKGIITKIYRLIKVYRTLKVFYFSYDCLEI